VVARRIVKRIERLAEHLDDIKQEQLTAKMSGFFKLRVGDYRVIQSENLIAIHRVGHRREVYR
jgi:mRNA interferase RelE/StbE